MRRRTDRQNISVRAREDAESGLQKVPEEDGEASVRYRKRSRRGLVEIPVKRSRRGFRGYLKRSSREWQNIPEEEEERLP
jgi:hypothetical protein